MKRILKLLTVILCISALLCSCANRDIPAGADPRPSESDGTDNAPSEVTDNTEKPLKRDEPGHIKTVVIDAGHGFGDVGCAGPQSKIGVYEYELTIDMANTLKNCFEARGFKVYLTHDGKSFPSVSEIASLADRYGVEYDTSKDQWEDNDIFSPYERVIYINCLDAMYGVDFSISVHVNANADSEELNGFDLDYCKENSYSAESWEIVKNIRSVMNENYPARNLYLYADTWEESFVVTKYNTMPSALFETAYSTNDTDAAFLKNPTWRSNLMDNLAGAIAKGIENNTGETK